MSHLLQVLYMHMQTWILNSGVAFPYLVSTLFYWAHFMHIRPWRSQHVHIVWESYCLFACISTVGRDRVCNKPFSPFQSCLLYNNTLVAIVSPLKTRKGLGCHRNSKCLTDHRRIERETERWKSSTLVSTVHRTSPGVTLPCLATRSCKVHFNSLSWKHCFTVYRY